jgi:N-acetylmuramic acid 6-phosphate etherase
VLNAITTAAMVRLGKVYKNLMVDLRPGSAKLRDRALRIIEAASAVSRGEAERYYNAAEGEVKTAIVMASTGLGMEDARQRLRATAGHVRQALEGQPA